MQITRTQTCTGTHVSVNADYGLVTNEQCLCCIIYEWPVILCYKSTSIIVMKCVLLLMHLYINTLCLSYICYVSSAMLCLKMPVLCSFSILPMH